MAKTAEATRTQAISELDVDDVAAFDRHLDELARDITLALRRMRRFRNGLVERNRRRTRLLHGSDTLTDLEAVR